LSAGARPTLVVVSGPWGSGKTTLAHRLAEAIGCPAVCRDEIKEGMVHAHGGRFEAAFGDPLTQRTYPLFFDVLRLLLEGGVSVVAEAAFQDRLWSDGLEPLAGLAELRIVHCVVDSGRAAERAGVRGTRRAHADLPDVEEWRRHFEAFERVSISAPQMEVDTSDGYQPGLQEIVDFVG
jgi:predicted kinase